MSDNAFSASFLLSLLEDVEIPESSSVDDPPDKEFDCRDGWKVWISYDVGELDYINHFVTPEGEIVDFWKWPESEDKTRLMNWR